MQVIKYNMSSKYTKSERWTVNLTRFLYLKWTFLWVVICILLLLMLSLEGLYTSIEVRTETYGKVCSTLDGFPTIFIQSNSDTEMWPIPWVHNLNAPTLDDAFSREGLVLFSFWNFNISLIEQQRYEDRRFTTWGNLS